MDRNVIGEQLERDDAEQTLEAVDRLGHADELALVGEGVVALAVRASASGHSRGERPGALGDDDRLTLAREDLLQRRLDLGVETVLACQRSPSK